MKRIFCFPVALLMLTWFYSSNLVLSKIKKVDIIGQTDSGSAISGTASINSRKREGALSRINLIVDRLSSEIEDDLSRGDVLEAWIVDQGLATDSAASSANDDDSPGSFRNAFTDASYSIQNQSSVSIDIGNISIIKLMESIPYALSLGTLKANGKGNYIVEYQTRNSLSPYDFIMITKESKGNQGDYDPRPGEEVARASIEGLL
jgi:hypothetical protein